MKRAKCTRCGTGGHSRALGAPDSVFAFGAVIARRIEQVERGRGLVILLLVILLLVVRGGDRRSGGTSTRCGKQCGSGFVFGHE